MLFAAAHKSGITLEIRPASFRKLRGPTYIAVIADELAFWYVDAAYANPDVEILNAVEPGLATTGGPLILASSPHARRGALWDVFKRHYGAGGDPLILVAHGPSRTLNPSLPQRVVDRALEKDRARATAEYLASSAPTSRASSHSKSSKVAWATTASSCRRAARLSRLCRPGWRQWPRTL